MARTAEEAMGAVQAFLAQVPGSRPGQLTARPFQDGYLVRPAEPTAEHTGGLFLVRRGQVRFVGSAQVPQVHRIWVELVTEQG